MADVMRLVSVEYALNQIKTAENECGENFETDSSHVKDFLRALPVVEAVPIVHGFWVEHKWAEEYEGRLISNYECSVCHEWFRDKTNFSSALRACALLRLRSGRACGPSVRNVV